jgi:hypothetical protein
MSHRILIGLLSAGTIAALSATDAAACGGSKHLSAAEHARNEREIWVHRKAVQARNISAIDKILRKATVSAGDRRKAKALRDRAATLSGGGNLDEADRVLRGAWKTLGRPELHEIVLRVNC